jgi:hypothetical protein
MTGALHRGRAVRPDRQQVTSHGGGARHSIVAEGSPFSPSENLTRAFTSHRGYLTEKEVAIVARTLLQVVEYCHRQNVLHRGEVQVDDNLCSSLSTFKPSAFDLL